MVVPESREEAIGTPYEFHWRTPDDWPRHVRLVSNKELGANLGIDRRNRLYWAGVPIVTKHTVRLEGWSLGLAFVATAATAIATAWPILLYFGVFGLKPVVG
jgi:hypothetical protein